MAQDYHKFECYRLDTSYFFVFILVKKTITAWILIFSFFSISLAYFFFLSFVSML